MNLVFMYWYIAIARWSIGGKSPNQKRQTSEKGFALSRKQYHNVL